MMQMKSRHFQWTELIIDSGMKPLSKYLCLYLSTFMNAKQDFAWPGLKRIEHETGLTTPTILKYLDLAESSGYLLIERGDRKTSNKYYSKLPLIVLNVIKQEVLKDVKQGTKTHDAKVLKDVKCNRQENKQSNNQHTFDEFWDLYPKHIGSKKKIEKKWNSLNGEKSLIIEDLKTRSWGDKKYIPHPTTYLNNDRWLDEREDSAQSFLDSIQ